MKFWFDRGVAGSRLDATRHYMEDPSLHDEEIQNINVPISEITYWDYNHTYTADLWESYEFINELRKFVDIQCSTRNDQK